LFQVVIVFLAQPGAERLLAQFAVALAAVLIGDMPDQQGRVILVAIRQLAVDGLDFLAVNGEVMQWLWRTPCKMRRRSAVTRSTSGYFADIQAGRAPLGVAKTA
jgi:hypothetical protein